MRLKVGNFLSLMLGCHYVWAQVYLSKGASSLCSIIPKEQQQLGIASRFKVASVQLFR